MNYEIKHYQTEFEIDEQGHYFLSGLNLSGSQVADPVIMVLNQPEQAVLPLQPISTEGVETGKYKLPRLNNVGPCLIIPRDQKSIKFRPKFIVQQVSADSCLLNLWIRYILLYVIIIQHSTQIVLWIT